MHRIFFIIFILQVSTLFAQAEQPRSILTENDSLTFRIAKPSVSELKQILKIENNYDPFTLHVRSEANKILADVYNPNQYYQPYLHAQKGLGNIERGKLNLKYAMQLQPKFLEAGDLGWLGQVFLYMNAAAAGYALYKHLEKYGDEY